MKNIEYMYMYIQIYTYTYIHIYIYTYIHIYIYFCSYIHIFTHQDPTHEIAPEADATLCGRPPDGLHRSGDGGAGVPSRDEVSGWFGFGV